MKGFALHDLLDMDLLSFNELLESANRIDMAEKADRAYALLMAHQAEGKQVMKWIKSHYLSGVVDKDEEAATSEAAFKARFGGGF